MPTHTCQYCGQEFRHQAAWEIHEEHCLKNPDKSQVETTAEPVSYTSQLKLQVPQADPHFFIPEKIAAKLNRINQISVKHPANVLVTGLQGNGKTSLCIQFAAAYNRPIFISPCVTMQEPREWWGEMLYRPDRGTYYQTSLFVEAVQVSNCVIVLDDLNRVENPKVANPLFPLLDDRRETYLQELGQYLRVAPGIVFFATVNEGWEFQGIDPIDRAFRDRFHQVELPMMREGDLAQIIILKTGLQKAQAVRLAAFALAITESPEIEGNISTRQILLVAEDLAYGASIQDALKLTLLPNFSSDARQQVMLLAQTHLEIMEAEHESWTRFPA